MRRSLRFFSPLQGKNFGFRLLYQQTDVYQRQGVDHALVLWGCLNPEGIEATYRLEQVEDVLQFAGQTAQRHSGS